MQCSCAGSTSWDRGNIDLAHGLGLEMGPLADQFSNDIASLLIDRMMGTTHMFRGELGGGERGAGALRLSLRARSPRRTLSEYGATDNHTTVQCCRICVSVLMGRLEDARRLQEETVAEAEQLGRVHNLCHVLAYGGAIGSALQQDWTAMARYVQQLNELAGPHELPFWEATVSFLRGIEAAHEGDPCAGADLRRRSGLVHPQRFRLSPPHLPRSVRLGDGASAEMTPRRGCCE